MKPLQNKTVLDYGAKGDGITDDGAAFQRALDATTAGPLHVPQGNYLIGCVLRLASGSHLHLDPNARLQLADHVATKPDDYFLTNASPEEGNCDITIEGGTWDGNSSGNPRPTGLFDFGCSGALMHFQNIRGLKLINLHIHNAEAYHVRLTQVDGFHIENIRFSADIVRPNNDGIHLGGHCENGVIRNIKGLHPGVTGDDLVALNADDALTRTEVKGMTCGPIRNIEISDIAAEGCHSFVRLLSVTSPIENVTIHGVRGTCQVAAINCDAARGCRVPVFDESAPPYPDGVGMLRNISIDDCIVAKSKANGIALLRLETRMENFRFTNLSRNLEVDLDPNTPTIHLNNVAIRKMQMNGQEYQPIVFGDSFEMNDSKIDELSIN
jgi:polygalacturonase